MLNEIDPRHEDLIAASAAIAGDDPYSMVIAYARLGVDRRGVRSLRRRFERHIRISYLAAGHAGVEPLWH